MGTQVSVQAEDIPLSDRKKDERILNEDVYLIWVGPIPIAHTAVTLKSKLKKATSSVQICPQLNECLRLIKPMRNGGVFIILNSVIKGNIMNLIEELNQQSQVDTIFILDNVQRGTQTTEDDMNQFSKINHIFSLEEDTISEIRKRIRLAIKMRLDINMFDQDKQSTTRDLTRNMAGFLWFQVLLSVLRELPQSEDAKQDMINLCSNYYRSQDDQTELTNIEEYKNSYSIDEAIHWYTRDCFLYKLLNKALRTENVRSIWAFRTFIVDLCDQIDFLHKERIANGENKDMVLFRGQQVTRREHNQILTSTNKLISTNGFISTTYNASLALGFALKNARFTDLKPILFRIQVPSHLKKVIFADISESSAYTDEQEVLFSLGATFKILQFEEKSGADSYTLVDIVATDEGHDTVTNYINLSKNDLESDDKKVIFGRLLIDMGQYRESENYFTDLIDYMNKTGNENAIECAPYYHNKGRALACMGAFNEALNFMDRARTIRQKNMGLKAIEFAHTLSSMGVIEGKMGQYQKAMQNFQDALNIFEEDNIKITNPSSHQLHIAIIKSNIGWVNYLKGNYNESQKCHLEAHKIRQRFLPKQHALIADDLSALGAINHAQGKYREAIEHFNTALDMRQQTLPNNHPTIATSYQSLGNVELENGRYDKAKGFYESARDIYCDAFGDNHWLIADSYKSIGSVHLEMCDYKKALEYFALALEMLIRNMSKTHPTVGECYHYIGITYERMGSYNEANENYDKALPLIQGRTAVNHPSLAKLFISMANTSMRNQNISQAEMFLNRAYDIQKAVYSDHHPDIVLTLNNYGVLYTRKKEYEKSKDYLLLALDMCKKCFSPNHPAVARTMFNLGELYFRTGEDESAVGCYEEAIRIQADTLPADDRNIADSHAQAACVYFKMKQDLKAKQHLTICQNIYQHQQYKRVDPDLARIERNLRKVNNAIKKG